MARPRKGTIQKRDGQWVVRFTFTDELGRRRDVRRKLATRAEAGEELRRLERSLETRGTKAIESDRMTLADLAAYFDKTYLVPARYVDGRKVAGLRSVDHPKRHLRQILDHYGRRRLRAITYGDIERYKAARLAAPTRGGGQRSIASVNRELAVLRRMLNVAVREGWLARSPFTLGEPLISLADERKRERILTRDEEERLLAACSGRRSHLRPIVVTALDTGMRKGEIFKLRWSDIDFEAGLITVRAFNTKTLQSRVVAITTRLERQLQELWAVSTGDPEVGVFGVEDNVKRSFTSARKAAGLDELRFHDLRHTAATRLVAGHVPLAEVGRVLGHTQANTTYRYVNATVETARRAAAALDAFHAEAESGRQSDFVS